MKGYILLFFLFVPIIQIFSENGRHHFEAVGSGCTSPTGLTSSGITQSSAILHWNAVPGASSYHLEYESKGLWTGVFVPGTSYTLTGLTSNTTYSYHVLTLCSGSYSVYSPPASFTTRGNVINCTSKGNSTAHEFISRVNFGSINNLSGDNGGYKNYTSLSTNLTAGQAYTIKLTPGFHTLPNTQYWSVYIDLNHNNSFADAGERLFSGSSSTLLSGSLNMPSTFTNGPTHMRIQMHYGSYITNPCATFDYGEVEDYTVNLFGAGRSAQFVTNGNFAKTTNPESMTAVSISPNPVQGSNTTITYRLTNTGRVTLRIIDIYGRAATTTDLGLQRAGVHSYVLNYIKDVPGNYFIKIEQENSSIGEAKLILLH